MWANRRRDWGSCVGGVVQLGGVGAMLNVVMNCGDKDRSPIYLPH